MRELSLFLAAVAQLSPTDTDTGAGAPPRIPGHEADRLASMGTAHPERSNRPQRPASGRDGRWRRFGVRPATAASPS
ncbi:hypothetical protein [Peterkaempfera sp. SMS 1(5)a]|uniref:hypothetical protein n=1 Tax=Peterkaempfera podocarpi TaxID=3232308 RepID=UPI00366E2EFD